MKTTVLVVEDNEQNLFLVTYMLEKSGYEVLEAHDGLEAIEKANLHIPDLVLMDIQLPGMDGLTVAAKLKAMPKVAHTPIVAVTSYAMIGDKERFLRSGCAGYIEKPIDPDTFVSEIEKYIKGQGIADGEA